MTRTSAVLLLAAGCYPSSGAGPSSKDAHDVSDTLSPKAKPDATPASAAHAARPISSSTAEDYLDCTSKPTLQYAGGRFSAIEFANVTGDDELELVATQNHDDAYSVCVLSPSDSSRHSCVGVPAPVGQLAVGRRAAGGTFAAFTGPTETTLGILSLSHPPAAAVQLCDLSSSMTLSVVATDLDGDGGSELLVTRGIGRPSLQVLWPSIDSTWLTRGYGSSVAGSLATFQGPAGKPAFAMVGISGAFVHLRWGLSRDATSSPNDYIALEDRGRSVAVGDFNGDGLSTLAILEEPPSGPRRIELLDITAAGKAGHPRLAAEAGQARGLVAFDLDRDGIDDLAFLNQDGKSVSWLRGTRHGLGKQHRTLKVSSDGRTLAIASSHPGSGSKARIAVVSPDGSSVELYDINGNRRTISPSVNTNRERP